MSLINNITLKNSKKKLSHFKPKKDGVTSVFTIYQWISIIYKSNMIS